MAMRNRLRRPARRESQQDPKPLILVVCEGKATEPEYLESFVEACRNPRVSIKAVPAAGVPMTIVRRAKQEKREAERRAAKERDEYLRYDQIWGVFDIDDHPDVARAKSMARANDIKLAVSNPCVELWLLLHFAEQPGAKERRELRRRVKKYLPAYDKHIDFMECQEGYHDAVRRARGLDESADAESESGRNPTTGFWRLTESIRSDSKFETE